MKITDLLILLIIFKLNVLPQNSLKNDCNVKGKIYKESDEFHHPDDHCILCTCDSNGKSSCRAIWDCHALNCSNNFKHEEPCCDKLKCLGIFFFKLDHNMSSRTKFAIIFTPVLLIFICLICLFCKNRKKHLFIQAEPFRNEIFQKIRFRQGLIQLT